MSLAQGRVYNALLVGGGSQVRVNKSNNLDTLALEIGSMNRLILFIEMSSTNIVHHLSKCNFSLFSAHFNIHIPTDLEWQDKTHIAYGTLSYCG